MSPQFLFMGNYREISGTPTPSKVFYRLVLVRLGMFMECRDMLLTTQFSYRKGVDHALQSALKTG